MSAITFDLDDTLFDHAAAMSAFLRVELGLEASAVEALLQVDARGSGGRDTYCAAVGRIAAMDAAAVWQLMLERFALHAVPSADGVFAEAASRFAVGLLTNGGSVMQRSKVRTLGLDRLIPADRILISGELGFAKPDERAFRAALAALGSGAERTVHVGDDVRADIGGARGVGMLTCWVARGRVFPDTPQPDWTIDTIADLPTIWDQFPT